MIFNSYSDSSEGLFGLSIVSAGHIFARPGREISRPRGRQDWLLFYVAKGREKFRLDGLCEAGEGSFVLFRPGQPQHHETLEEATEFYYIHFNAPADFDPFGLPTFAVCAAKSSATVRDRFESVIDELQRKQYCYEKICVSLFLEILGLLARRNARREDPNRRYADRISFVILHMNREFHRNETLNDYAARCGMSKFHFLRVFKEITGLSPMEYRNRLRLEHAKTLLEDRSLPIGEIGLRVGFSSPSYFCDAFKKKTGLSPQQYREK